MALGVNTEGLHKLGINTGKIFDVINSAEKKLSPFAKYSNARVNMFKFLAGPESSLVDKIAEHLNDIKK